VRRSQRAFFHDGPVGSLHAITDTFLVYIESDIVVDVHWVLLFQVSEPVVNTRSRHCSLQENPSSFRSLYIQTCGISFPLPASGPADPLQGKLTPFSCPDAFAAVRNIAKHLPT